MASELTLTRPTQQLSPEDAAYLGGLIDGEGTISLTRRHAGERRQLVVSISSTESCILDWVLATVATGKITRKRVVSSRHAPGLTYSISNRQALSVLTQVSPYLRSYKRRRAQLVLERYLILTPRNGKYSDATSRARDEFERDFLQINARQHPARAPTSVSRSAR